MTPVKPLTIKAFDDILSLAYIGRVTIGSRDVALRERGLVVKPNLGSVPEIMVHRQIRFSHAVL